MKNRTKYDLLKRLISTEKTSRLLADGVYVFEVLKDSTKKEVKNAVESIFGVRVKSVRTSITHGKVRVFRGSLGVVSGFKKALIKLDGGKIDFNNVQ